MDHALRRHHRSAGRAIRLTVCLTALLLVLAVCGRGVITHVRIAYHMARIESGTWEAYDESKRVLAEEIRRPAIPALMRALADGRPEASWRASRVLLHMDVDGEMVPYLSHESARVRAHAAFAVGLAGIPSAMPEFTRLLEDSSFDVRFSAAAALARQGSRAGVSVLVEGLAREETRKQSRYWLTVLQGPEE